MCSCDFNYECAKCAMGVWPYDRERLADWREEEIEKREQELSRHDFDSPYRDAA